MALDICRDHLHKHGLEASQASKPTPVSFELPPLQGKDLDEHFWTIGRQASQPWLGYADEFAQQMIAAPPVDHVDEEEHNNSWGAENWIALDPSLQSSVPLRPATFSTEPGWTAYPFLRTSDGHIAGLGNAYSVPYPDLKDTALTFDIEVLVRESPFPVMATAVGKHAWYSWVSPYLAGKGERWESPKHLIPLGPADGSAPRRLLISHNAGYDRAAVLDEYTLHGSSIRWMDTMSLHVATSGISSPQRAEWQLHARRRTERRLKRLLAAKQVQDETKAFLRTLLEDGELDDEALATLQMNHLDGWVDELKSGMDHQLELIEASMSPEDRDELLTSTDEDQNSVLWQDVTSKNSLADVAALYCGIEIDKEARNKFIDGTSLQQIREECSSLLAYCAKDVATTHAVFSKVWPSFRLRCPHPATAAGVLALGSTFLPVDRSWETYQTRANAKFDEMNLIVVHTLCELAHALKEAGVHAIDAHNATGKGDRWWETDPWYGQLDWTPKKPKKAALPTTYLPAWYAGKLQDSAFRVTHRMAFVPLLLQLRIDGHPILPNTSRRGWVYNIDGVEREVSSAPVSKTLRKHHHITCGDMPEIQRAWRAIVEGEDATTINQLLRDVVESVRQIPEAQAMKDPQWSRMDWTPKAQTDSSKAHWWPHWFWEAYSNKENQLVLSIRSKLTPLLLKLAWDKNPLYRSREHGWVYGMKNGSVENGKLHFNPSLDPNLARLADTEPEACFYKLPHGKGDGSNVGNPFSKGLQMYFENMRLESLHPSEEGKALAKRAVECNAMCSYWISVRDRVERQNVIWDGDANTCMGFASSDQHDEQRGMILPQVISMGTVTRRAIEKTWLTASNAKTNRIGSELKAMVRAPPGWCIVGADVDSEELWICSVMGDAQFGLHGATAIGWMTLEGSKQLGTDLHSKTASILGTSRNHAKIFNYSRIYGAGIRHAMHLLLKAKPNMPVEEATERAKQLYAATKGQSTFKNGAFQRRFWYGGTESYVFNKLEEIATSDNPRTPALDCGITAALSKKYLPDAKHGEVRQDYMPSRINWVVQSSGVDYLHLLITAMDYLCRTYDIQARFMLSVHDEVRYLAKEKDRFRTALALQIANLWTRAMFAHKLNMDDLPESCAWFSEVDIDHVLRKEVHDPCVTPSQPDPISPGESLTIFDILDKTKGSLLDPNSPTLNSLSDAKLPMYVSNHQQHRCTGKQGLLFLQAQGSLDINEIRALDRRARLQSDVDFSPTPMDNGHRSGNRKRKPSSSSVSSSSWKRQAHHQSQRSLYTHTLRTRSNAPHELTGKSPHGLNSVLASRSISNEASPKIDLDSLMELFPRRARLFRRRFFTQTGYRRSIIHLFRHVLRAVQHTPASYHKDLRLCIRRKFRDGSRIRSFPKAWEHCRMGMQLLDDLRNYSISESAHQAVNELLTAYREEFYDDFEPSDEKTQVKAYPTGALLPPTLYNPPMLRYKPEQPPKITMMINARRVRREKRMQRWSEVQEMRQLIMNDMQSGAEGEKQQWLRPLQAFERQMQEQFAREQARSRMVFDQETLKRAKEARHKRNELRKNNARRKAISVDR
ncbi:DNA-directed DNA polymerase [Malassezia psittaci]|uniref:Mitochondrial DNA polymerase catalytic subunit n=1 Tax=Malassezia psittaci TaxID=1821823 RepID=A0AAF0FDF5_9BASI|nr:DNA-directed DNA polymerase [Malassezia psittaci]